MRKFLLLFFISFSNFLFSYDVNCIFEAFDGSRYRQTYISFEYSPIYKKRFPQHPYKFPEDMIFNGWVKKHKSLNSPVYLPNEEIMDKNSDGCLYVANYVYKKGVRVQPEISLRDIYVYEGTKVNPEDVVVEYDKTRYVIVWERKLRSDSVGKYQVSIEIRDKFKNERFIHYPVVSVNILEKPKFKIKENIQLKWLDNVEVSDLLELSEQDSEEYSFEIIENKKKLYVSNNVDIKVSNKKHGASYTLTIPISWVEDIPEIDFKDNVVLNFDRVINIKDFLNSEIPKDYEVFFTNSDSINSGLGKKKISITIRNKVSKKKWIVEREYFVEEGVYIKAKSNIYWYNLDSLEDNIEEIYKNIDIEPNSDNYEIKYLGKENTNIESIKKLNFEIINKINKVKYNKSLLVNFINSKRDYGNILGEIILKVNEDITIDKLFNNINNKKYSYSILNIDELNNKKGMSGSSVAQVEIINKSNLKREKVYIPLVFTEKFDEILEISVINKDEINDNLIKTVLNLNDETIKYVLTNSEPNIYYIDVKVYKEEQLVYMKKIKVNIISRSKIIDLLDRFRKLKTDMLDMNTNALKYVEVKNNVYLTSLNSLTTKLKYNIGAIIGVNKKIDNNNSLGLFLAYINTKDNNMLNIGISYSNLYTLLKKYDLSWKLFGSYISGINRNEVSHSLAFNTLISFSKKFNSLKINSSISNNFLYNIYHSNTGINPNLANEFFATLGLEKKWPKVLIKLDASFIMKYFEDNIYFYDTKSLFFGVGADTYLEYFITPNHSINTGFSFKNIETFKDFKVNMNLGYKYTWD